MMWKKHFDILSRKTKKTSIQITKKKKASLKRDKFKII